MHKLFFINFLLISSFTFAQNPIGTWQGNININSQQIPIVFHFYKDTTGKLTGKWDSPTQNANNLPCSNITVNADSIVIDLKIISGFYNGKFITPDSMAGTWHQGNGRLLLNLVRTSNNAAFNTPKRPQTPKPPFPYEADSITYANADNTMHYGATFTKPFDKTNKKYPAVLLITGSGKQDRDENIFDHKPFAVIADYLTKNGIAVLRVDDRGMGETTGSFDTSSSQDFAKDVECGIKYLESRKDVDVKNIGLIGHSEGGMIAPMVAAENKSVSFIIMLAGTGVQGNIINDRQNILPMKTAGVNKDIIEKFLQLHHVLIAAAMLTTTINEFKDDVPKIYYGWKKQQTEETINTLIKGTDEQAIAALENKYIIFHSKWWKFFLTHDPSKDIERLSIPVLALNGSKDIQVDPKTNLPAIENALKKSKSKNYTTRELPGLNHLFQHCKKCTIEEYGELEETFAPEVLEIMRDWIKNVVKE